MHANSEWGERRGTDVTGMNHLLARPSVACYVWSISTSTLGSKLVASGCRSSFLSHFRYGLSLDLICVCDGCLCWGLWCRQEHLLHAPRGHCGRGRQHLAYGGYLFPGGATFAPIVAHVLFAQANAVVQKVVMFCGNICRCSLWFCM